MTRELVLDTETTGLNHEEGHRLVEIGIIELENHVPTGQYFHYYLNPERASDKRAEEIHGLTNEFLKDKPKFSEIAEEFLEFISNSKIIIHNATFDLGFINAELSRCNLNEIKEESVIDTLTLAKQKFLGQSVSLDALCRKYNIDLKDRQIHGALKDAKLLATVYLELIGGRQSKLKFENTDDKFINKEDDIQNIVDYYINMPHRKINRIDLNVNDYEMHLKNLDQIKNSMWKKLDS
jgi:DNA polymerase-3 subunit epsilon